MTDIIKEPALNFNGFYDQARQKLQAAQHRGKSGWDTRSVENLQKGALKAIEEGHWVDLANYALFMWARGEYGFPIAGKEANESLRDALRLANITIEQQHQSIADLKEANSEALNTAHTYYSTEISRLVDGMNKVGIKHGTFTTSTGVNLWEFGEPRVSMGRVPEVEPASPESRLNDVALEQGVAELATTGLSAYLTCNRVGDENVISLEYKDVPLESVATITASIEKLAAILSNQPSELSLPQETRGN